MRFGAPSTAVWTAFTTGASDGGVNAMHDSYMPLGGGMAMFMIQLGEMLPGGVGSGLYGMVVMALHRGLRGRADGRANAGVPRQEDRGARGQVRHAGGR